MQPTLFAASVTGKLKKTLFLIKKNENYGSGGGYLSSGLFNSCNMLKDQLIKLLGVSVALEVCVDENVIDRYLVQHKPDLCVIEAIWVTPAKLVQLTKLHPKVMFSVRVHSKSSFLGNEGIATKWLKAYGEIPNASICFNNYETHLAYNRIGMKNHYSPNLYLDLNSKAPDNFALLKQGLPVSSPTKRGYSLVGETVNIACFGAIRPLKNQYFQAICAIAFAEQMGARLRFHVNGTRVEQYGQNVLKNIEALFDGTEHELVKHEWYNHRDFLDVIKTMDAGMQLSFTESFNIVAADFVNAGVPVITSSEIDWVGEDSIIHDLAIENVVDKLKQVLEFKSFFVAQNYLALNLYNKASANIWSKILAVK